MKKILAIAASVALMASCSCGGSSMVDSETPVGVQPLLNTEFADVTWEVIFSDEFGGDALDLSKWNVSNSPSTRAGRPDISIEEWYWKPENVWVKDGSVVLKVDKPKEGTLNCGAVDTRDKFEYQYGYMEANINLADVTKGTHTALWLVNEGVLNVDGTAHDGCEIDVVESAWDADYTEAVVHFDGYDEYHQSLGLPYTPVGMHDGFHVYGLYWSSEVLRFYYDGEFMTEFTGKWVPRVMEFLLLSDGASFGLEGDKYFKDHPIGYLTEAQIDYIRVWQAPGHGK